LKVVWDGFIVIYNNWKMTLSWRLELEFAGISCEFRVSSGLPLLFLTVAHIFLIWTNRIDIFFLTFSSPMLKYMKPGTMEQR